MSIEWQKHWFSVGCMVCDRQPSWAEWLNELFDKFANVFKTRREKCCKVSSTIQGVWNRLFSSNNVKPEYAFRSAVFEFQFSSPLTELYFFSGPFRMQNSSPMVTSVVIFWYLLFLALIFPIIILFPHQSEHNRTPCKLIQHNVVQDIFTLVIMAVNMATGHGRLCRSIWNYFRHFVSFCSCLISECHCVACRMRIKLPRRLAAINRWVKFKMKTFMIGW